MCTNNNQNTMRGALLALYQQIRMNNAEIYDGYPSREWEWNENYFLFCEIIL